LPINIAVPCGLVVNELISNALKHAFPEGRSGRIMVSMHREPDQKVVLSVSDDGIGLPDALDVEDTVTLGLHLVWLLADQLKATVKFQRSSPTCFELRFPMHS
jgi:two-component sensor histidine kinase